MYLQALLDGECANHLKQQLQDTQESTAQQAEQQPPLVPPPGG
jgi:hypothetical protein